MITDEQEIISEINSDLAYTQDQEESDVYIVTSGVRYDMKHGKRLDRMIILQKSTGKLFAVKPTEITYYDLSKDEKEEVNDYVENYNDFNDASKLSVLTKW